MKWKILGESILLVAVAGLLLFFLVSLPGVIILTVVAVALVSAMVAAVYLALGGFD